MKGYIEKLDRALMERVSVRILFSLLIPLACLRASLACLDIRYQTNDDATFANIAFGAYGSDNLHMIHPELLFSLMLRPLYSISPDLNWYVILQLFLAVVSVAAVIYVFEKNAGLRGLFASCALAIPFSVHIFYYFQFTKISALCISAGLILIADCLDGFTFGTVLGILLCLAGSSLRFESFIMAGALSSMVLLCRFFASDRTVRTKAATHMAVLFAVVFGAHLIDGVSYSMDPEWKQFRDYHKSRIEFSDFKVYLLDENDNPFRNDGVSDTDYELLMSWDYYDPARFTPRLLNELSDKTPPKAIDRTLSDTFATAKSLIRGDSFRYAFMLILLVGLFVTFLSFEGIFFALTYCVFLALLFYLHYRARFPLWVQAAMLMSVTIYGAYLLLRSSRSRKIPYVCYARLTLLLCVLTVPTLLRASRDSEIYHDWTVSKQESFEAMSRDKDNIYIISVENLDALAGYDVWHPRSRDFFSNIVVYGGMLSASPYMTEPLDKYSMTRPLIDGIDRSDVFYDGVGIERNERYILEQTGAETEFIKSSDSLLAPYNIRTKQNN